MGLRVQGLQWVRVAPNVLGERIERVLERVRTFGLETPILRMVKLLSWNSWAELGVELLLKRHCAIKH